jgi:alpha-N-arabinofuranosidase
VLEHTYEHVDYVSLHAYYEEVDGDLATFLATAVDMDHFIEAVAATADHVAAKLRSPKRLRLSFDEWNVWYQRRFAGAASLEWQHARPFIEDTYDVADAVVVGSYLVSLLNHADRVGIACQAQLVNIIAPVRTEPGGRAWRQTIFHPFAQAARHARGEVLRAEISSPTYPTESYGHVPLLTAAATHDPDTGEVCVLAVNRGTQAPLPVEVDLRGFPALHVVEHSVLSDPDIRAVNTADDPDRVVPRPGGAVGAAVRLDGGRLHVELPPVSWTVLRLSPTPEGR